MLEKRTKKMRMELRAGMAAVLLVLGGCATGPNVKGSSDQYSSLYSGKSTLAYATQFPSSSAKEANQRGDEALRRGDTDLALFHYVSALELEGGDPDTLYKIGKIHDSRGNLGSAQLAYQMTLKLSGDHAGALEGAGLILLQNRQYDAAGNKLARAVEIDPNRWRAHNGLGVLADLREDYTVATSHYSAALKVNPNSPQLFNNFAYSRYLDGDLDAAQENLQYALNKDPRYERAWMNLGLMHTRRGQYNEALNAFRQVMSDAEAWNNIGYLCMMDGKYDEAESFIIQAITMSPNYYANAHENLKRVQEMRSTRSRLATSS